MPCRRISGALFAAFGCLPGCSVAFQHVQFVRRNKGITTQKMVFSASEAMLEQTSTQVMLDGILDESLRTSGRRPIMIQFEPSSKAVRRMCQALLSQN